jgi:hypothetical protein
MYRLDELAKNNLVLSGKLHRYLVDKNCTLGELVAAFDDDDDDDDVVVPLYQVPGCDFILYMSRPLELV